MRAPDGEARWLAYLSDDDLAFVKRFIRASGSLKEMASIYKVSYPTVRLRLDRLIQKIDVVDDPEVTSPFERTLRARYADGAIDTSTFKTLLQAYREENGDKNAT